MPDLPNDPNAQPDLVDFGSRMRVAWDAFVLDGKTYAEAAELSGLPLARLQYIGSRQSWGRMRAMMAESAVRNRAELRLAEAAKADSEATLERIVRQQASVAEIEKVLEKKLEAIKRTTIDIPVMDAAGNVVDKVQAPLATAKEISDLLTAHGRMAALLRALAQVPESMVRERIRRAGEYAKQLTVAARAAGTHALHQAMGGLAEEARKLVEDAAAPKVEGNTGPLRLGPGDGTVAPEVPENDDLNGEWDEEDGAETPSGTPDSGA